MKKIKVKILIGALEKFDPEGIIALFEYENDQLYRISESPIEGGGGKYIMGIKKIDELT